MGFRHPSAVNYFWIEVRALFDSTRQLTLCCAVVPFANGVLGVRTSYESPVYPRLSRLSTSFHATPPFARQAVLTLGCRLKLKVAVRTNGRARVKPTRWNRQDCC